jgi:mRNA-degrading endonuclease RelE of RelBE toxin-antitoxin system
VPATAPAAQSPRKAATSLHRQRGAEDAHRRPEVGASSDAEGVGQEISVPIVAKRGLCVASAVLGSQLSLARMASVPNYMAVINLILGFQYGRHNLRILRYFQSFPNLTHEALKQPESLHLARRHDRSAGLRMSKNKRSEAIFRIVEDAIKFTARSSSGDCAFHFFPKSSGVTAGISGLPSCFIPHKVSQCQVFSTFFCTFPCILATHVVRWGNVKPKTRPESIASAAAPKTVRLGYSVSADEFYKRLPAKTQAALDRKLRAFGENLSIGKPLAKELIGFYRVTVGRIRAIAASSASSSIEAVLKLENGIVIVYVLHIGQRKAGSKDDPYDRAVQALARGDSDAIEVMRLLVEQVKAKGPAIFDSD